ncbi:MAG: DUF4340 domain-containing protein, partial [Planctomycetota bacterium]|nr:DUF4340 domain-containing protein [Planctomycetota bacterium]
MFKKILVPLIFLIVFIIIALVLKGPWGKSTYSPAIPKKVITNFEPDQINRIELSQKDKQIILKRQENKWVVATSFNYPANQEKVSELLNKVKNLKQSDIASRNVEKHSIFQVDAEQGKLLKILDTKEVILSDIYIGKTASDFQSTYVRPRNSDEVVIVDDNLGRLVPLETKLWLDRTIFKFDYKEITQITLKSTIDDKTTELVLKQAENEEWFILSRSEGSIAAPETYPCDKVITTDLAKCLSNLELEDVASTTVLATYGLDNPQHTVLVQRKDKPPSTLLIG